jgi:hypothetical protein
VSDGQQLIRQQGSRLIKQSMVVFFADQFAPLIHPSTEKFRLVSRKGLARTSSRATVGPCSNLMVS